MVSQFISAPRLPQWEVFLRMVKYLKSHTGRPFFYGANGHLRVETFTNKDWADHPTKDPMQDIAPHLVEIWSLGIQPWLTVHIRLWGCDHFLKK